MPGSDVVRAAKYYNCTPWELLKQPIGWLHLATALETAELRAQREIALRNRPHR